MKRVAAILIGLFTRGAILPARAFQSTLITSSVWAAALMLPISATAAELAVDYLIELSEFRGTLANTSLLFELFEDATCSDPSIHGEFLLAGTPQVRAEKAKTQRLRKESPPSNHGIRLKATLVSSAVSPQIYLRVSGPGIVAIGSDCQLQSASVNGNDPSAPSRGSVLRVMDGQGLDLGIHVNSETQGTPSAGTTGAQAYDANVGAIIRYKQNANDPDTIELDLDQAIVSFESTDCSDEPLIHPHFAGYLVVEQDSDIFDAPAIYFRGLQEPAEVRMPGSRLDWSSSARAIVCVPSGGNRWSVHANLVDASQLPSGLVGPLFIGPK